MKCALLTGNGPSRAARGFACFVTVGLPPFSFQCLPNRYQIHVIDYITSSKVFFGHRFCDQKTNNNNNIKRSNNYNNFADNHFFDYMSELDGAMPIDEMKITFPNLKIDIEINYFFKHTIKEINAKSKFLTLIS